MTLTIVIVLYYYYSSANVIDTKNKQIGKKHANDYNTLMFQHGIKVTVERLEFLTDEGKLIGT